MNARTLRIASIALGLCTLAPRAFAQMDPEGGDVWVPPPDETAPTETEPEPTEQEGGTPWYQGGPTGRVEPAQAEAAEGTTPPASEAAEPAPSTGQDDHLRVVGHLGFGYMGISNVPIGGLGSPATSDVITAPALGVRYWLMEMVGIDVGIGLGVLGGSTDTGDLAVPVNSGFAMTIHAGAPIALFHAQHYKFLVIPEVNFGFSTGTLYDPVNTAGDRERGGLLFQLGGRLGGEIHFGFMNIPQLSLQAGIGLYFQYASATVGAPRAVVETRDPIAIANANVGSEVTSLATTVEGEPWQILIGSLNALYYF